MERLAKRLKKEKIHVDVVSFGEEEENIDKLSHFIETINGTEQKESKYNRPPAAPSLFFLPTQMSSCSGSPWSYAF